MFKYLLVDVARIVSCLMAQTFIFFCACPAVCTVCVVRCLISTQTSERRVLQNLLFGPRGAEARYCVKQSGVKTHRSIPRCFPTVRSAVGEINNCGLRSGFSSLSWPFHLGSSYCAVVYFTAQKTDSSYTKLYLDSDILVCYHVRILEFNVDLWTTFIY